MQYRITRPAQRAFERIYSVFYEFAGQRNAEKMVVRVDDCLKKLQKSPHSGHLEVLLADRSRQYRSVPLNKNYSMIYYVAGDIIWIVDFWDRRNDPTRLTARIK